MDIKQPEPDNTQDRIEFARFINEHNLQLIGLVDTKTSIIVGATEPVHDIYSSH